MPVNVRRELMPTNQHIQPNFSWLTTCPPDRGCLSPVELEIEIMRAVARIRRVFSGAEDYLDALQRSQHEHRAAQGRS